MQVKKYRAATTREALEQVKQDLGEEAFVLETKQVRSKGFLGFGAQPQIEISAALPNTFSEKSLPKGGNKNAKGSLSLLDDELAAPVISGENEKKAKLMAALNERASAAKSFEKVMPPAPKKYGSILGLDTEQVKIETVELSPESPRIVHQKNEAVIFPQIEEKTQIEKPSASKNVSVEDELVKVPNREIEILRSEIRELKFSMSAFSARKQVESSNNVLEFEHYSEVFDSPFYDAYVDLATTGISPAKARKFIYNVIPHYKNGFIKETDEIKQAALFEFLCSSVKFEDDFLAKGEPAVVAFIGATGVGKTTTIAKLAARIALHERRRVELVTLDTYRIAAVEQLKTYAEIIGAGCQVVRSVLELDAVLRRRAKDTTILIDTTGKSPHDLADQYELSDYFRKHEEIRKCLAVQATTHPSDNLAAIERFTAYGADCLTLTKMDETTRPGASIELVSESRLPLVYLCDGQRVPEDLSLATPENFITRILGGKMPYQFH